MVAMKSYSIYLLTFVSNIINAVRCIPNYEFKILTVYTIKPGLGRPVHSTNPLLRLIPSEQRKLCQAAIEYAVKNNELLKKHTIVKMELSEFGIYSKPGVPPYDRTALRCPCLPTTVLFLPEKTENVLIVSVHRNEFLDERFTFIEETVDSVTPADPHPPPANSHPPSDSVLSKLEREYRWLLCAAAVGKIQHKVSVSLSEEWLEDVGLYNIADRGHSKEVAALKCNSSPVMYIRCATIHANIFVVVLEKSKLLAKAHDVVESSTEEFHSFEHSESNSEQTNES